MNKSNTVPAQNQENESTIDIFEYLYVLRRRWIVMLITLITVVTAGFIYTIRQQKIYQASVKIILKSENVNPLGRQVEELEGQGYYYWYGKEYRKTQTDIITSQKVMAKVVEDLQLGNDLDFLGIANAPADQIETLRKRANPVGILAGKVKVNLVREAETAVISVQDRNPRRAQLIANAVIRGYNKLRRENKLEMVASATSWLDEQAISLREKLDLAEHKLHEFHKEHKIEATSFEEYQQLISRRQSQLNQEFLGVKRKQWETATSLETLKQYLDDLEGMLNSPIVEKDETFKELSNILIRQKQNFVKVSSQYGSRHPTYKTAKAQLEGAQKALHVELMRVYNRTLQSKKEADRIAAHVSAELDKTKQEALRLNAISIDYQRLKYEIENYRNLYALVLKRSKEAQVSGVAQFLDVEVVEPALLPRAPVYPKPHVNLLLSFVIGFLLAVGVAFLLENLDTKLTGREDAEQIVGKPFLGTITAVNTESKELEEKLNNVTKKEKDAFNQLDPRGKVEFFPVYFKKSNLSESIRLVRTNLLFMGMDKQFRTLLVTSAHPKEGKSTVVNYLGLSLAAMGKRVILVDSDLHKPMLHNIYTLPNDVGVSSWMLQDIPTQDAIQETGHDNLHAMTSGPIPPNSAELLSSTRFNDLIEALQHEYDYVLLDSPPILALSDALIISHIADGILLVVQPELTDRSALRTTIRQLTDIQASVYGFVFNKIEMKKSSYYNKGGYYYSRYGRSYDAAYHSYHSDEATPPT